MFSLEEKTAVVTGAFQGVGYAVSERLRRAGAAVVMLDINRGITEKARGLSAGGVVLDVRDEEAVRDAMNAVAAEHGRIDILVNNAGIGGKEAPILDITPDEWDATHDINLKGLYFMSQACVKRMKEQGTGGRIINMASAAGIIAPKYVSVYGAAKAAVAHLTKIMANEWARYGINVNCVAPGYVTTDMTKDVMADEKNAEAVLKKISLRRYGEPEDVSGVVLFLATEASSYVTGVLIPIDGGMTIN